MVRRFHRSIYEELDELRASMDYLYQLALEPMDNPLVPEDDTPGIRCQYMHNLNAEIVEADDEVTVTIDTVPGTGNSKISVDLVNADTLFITCHHQEEKREDDIGNYPCNQRSFSLHHIIHLSVQVMKKGARLTSRNGVLDMHFKKALPYQI
jgi:HSP20 family molecular chaperone IbpA